MGTFLKLAWRNLWRNRLRSGLTVSAVVFGSALTVFMMAFSRGGHQQMIRSALGVFPGWLQVHRAGYQKEQSLLRSMPLKSELVKYLENSSLVKSYSPRLCTDALLQAGNNLSGARICGVIPEKEKQSSKVAKCFFPELLKVPRGFKPTRKSWGEFLAGKVGEAVIGEDLARNLQVKVGDEISMVSQDFYGSIASANFKVKGIFRAGSPEYDQALVLVNLEDLQELLYMPGMITELAIWVNNERALVQLERDIYQLLSDEPGPWQISRLANSNLYRVEVKKPNLAPDSPLQLVDQEIFTEAVKRIPALVGYSPQIKARMKLSEKEITVFGIEPEKEEQTSRIFSRLISSRGLASLPTSSNWLLLAKNIADELGLKPGEQVTLEGENYLGQKFQLDLNLVGIYQPGASEPQGYLELSLLQDQLRFGENVHQFLIRLKPETNPEKAEALIRSRLNYEVLPWQELMPDLVQFIALDNAGAVLWLLILLIVIAFVILLTVLMSVLERMREYGIMKAIGTKPGEIFGLIMLESFIIGFLGSAIGSVLGIIPSLYFTYIPMNLSYLGEYMEEFSLEPYMYAQFEPRMVFWTFVIIFAFVLIMSLFPALRASRTKPTEVLRLQ